MNNHPIIKISVPPFAVLIFHILATVIGWYETFWWFDIPLHFLGGVAIAISSIFFFEYFQITNRLEIKWWPLKILLIISLVGLSAVCWEFMEFTFDQMFSTNMQPGMVDTIKDLAVGLAGGILTALLFPKK